MQLIKVYLQTIYPRCRILLLSAFFAAANSFLCAQQSSPVQLAVDPMLMATLQNALAGINAAPIEHDQVMPLDLISHIANAIYDAQFTINASKLSALEKALIDLLVSQAHKMQEYAGVRMTKDELAQAKNAFTLLLHGRIIAMAAQQLSNADRLFRENTQVLGGALDQKSLADLIFQIALFVMKSKRSLCVACPMITGTLSDCNCKEIPVGDANE